MNDKDRAAAFLSQLRQIPALSELDESAARFLAGGSHLRCASRGQILYERGGPPTGLYCLLKGRVKLAALSADGSERVMDLVLPGRIFGQAATILNQPYPVFSQALCESELLHVGRERLIEAIACWPEIALILLRSVARDVVQLIHDVEACCLMSASQRLIDFLLNEASCSASGEGAVVTLPAAQRRSSPPA